jgi:glucose-6-phosphate 1-dehydrogenase
MALQPKDKPHIVEPSGQRPRSDTLVMFGASGDLAKKKLFPAVYRLQQRGLLGIPVVGVALDDWTQADLVEHARQAVQDDGETTWDDKTFEALAKNLRYVAGDYAKPETFEQVKAAVGGAEHPVFHLAIPPSLFETVANGLASVGLNEGSRLIIEKPFGRDLESARELNDHLHAHFWESAIFRIDHFLGKEALRSLLITRFANSILEPLWCRTFVSSVKITMAEAFGVEDRGAFYDSVGALRDVMQNHLLQMVAMFAMEQPVNESARALRDEKGKVLTAARPVDPAHFVRGQYDGYLDVTGCKPDSDTETYGAFRLDFDSPRWGGVPFFLRAGKALKDTVTEMTIVFAPPPRPLFLDDGSPHPPNMIRIEAKPNNFAAVSWLQKKPGDAMVAETIALAPPLDERADIGPEPYELLIEEAMKGDPTLFAREDSIEESWRIVEPILTDYPKVVPYKPGTWGPAEARRLVQHHYGWPEEPPA